MKKILIVFTGGTIGSSNFDGVVSVKKEKSNEYKLLKLYNEKYPNHSFSFDMIEPFSLLSENLHPKAWKKLVSEIEKKELDSYDGVIITHGTDTLAYSACFLSLYFNDLSIPVVLVSSDYILEDSRSNGLINFYIALEFIQNINKSGVFVSYKNQNENPKIHNASLITQSLPLECYFKSVQNKIFMEYIDNKFSLINENLSIIKMTKKIDFSNTKNVLLIHPYPGLDYNVFNLDTIDVVVHNLYHAGTACTNLSWGNNYSLLEFIKKCDQKNIPIFLAPMNDDDTIYETTNILELHGARVETNKTIEMVYVQKIFY